MDSDRLAIPHWAACALLIGALLVALHGLRIDIRTPDLTLSIALFQETAP